MADLGRRKRWNHWCITTPQWTLSLTQADLDKFRDWSIEAKLESPRENRLRGVIGVYHFEWERRTHRIDFASPEGQDRPYQISDIVNSAVFGSLIRKSDGLSDRPR